MQQLVAINYLLGQEIPKDQSKCLSVWSRLPGWTWKSSTIIIITLERSAFWRTVSLHKINFLFHPNCNQWEGRKLRVSLFFRPFTVLFSRSVHTWLSTEKFYNWLILFYSRPKWVSVILKSSVWHFSAVKHGKLNRYF